MYSVSSSFTFNAAQWNAAWQRQFLIGTSDYSSRVMQWPSIRRVWNDVSPATLNIDLAADDGAFNFFLTNPEQLMGACQLNMGFVYAPGSSEYITLFAGTIDSVQFQTGKVSIGIADKFMKLANTVVGDVSTPLSYTSSSYMVQDMAWYICTSLCGLSALTSTSNPDIDYTAFSSWSSLFSADNTRLQGSFTGQKGTELLQKISNLTQSAAYVENNKLKFSRFLISNAPTSGFSDADVIDTLVVLDQRAIVNQYAVNGAYNVASQTYGVWCTANNTSSIGSYGLHQDTTAETVMWLVDSISALNLAQRVVKQKANLFANFQVTAPLPNIASTIGDTMSYSDGQLKVSSASYRIMEETVDMDAGTKMFVLNASQFYTAFHLDISATDSTDVMV